MAKRIKIWVGRIRFWAGLLLAQFVLFFILSKIPSAVRLFEQFFELKKDLHTLIFSRPAFSAGDVFYIVFVLVLGQLSVLLFQRNNRKKTLKNLFIILNAVYFNYLLFWVLLYFHPPLIEKFESKEPTLIEAKQLATLLLQKCQNSRLQVGEDERGVFTIINFETVKQDILLNQRQIPVEISTKKAVLQNSIKPSLFTAVMSYTGISGYYNPFSSEAQYNPNLPTSHIPATIAHESAHQMGFAREQEASFIGYFIGKNSENADVRYSTEFFALKSLLRFINQQDSLFVDQTIASFSEGMKRDFEYEKEFAAAHDGLLDVFFAFTNDLFLKSNQQEGSITYSYFVDLLIQYEKAQKKNRVSQRDSKNTNDEKKYSSIQRLARP